MTDAVTIIAIAVLTYTLWVRRITFRCRWERAMTVGLVLQMCTLLLLLPEAASITGYALYHLTGHKLMDAALGECCAVAATFALLYSAICRVVTDQELPDALALPQAVVTITIPTMLGTFMASHAPNLTPHSDIFRVMTDGWLTIFWILFCTTMMYLFGLTIRAMLAVRGDRRVTGWVRRVNNLYIAGCVCGICAVLIRLTTAIIRPLQPIEDGILIWIASCIAGIVITTAAAQSWMNKKRWFMVLPDQQDAA